MSKEIQWFGSMSSPLQDTHPTLRDLCRFVRLSLSIGCLHLRQLLVQYLHRFIDVCLALHRHPVLDRSLHKLAYRVFFASYQVCDALKFLMLLYRDSYRHRSHSFLRGEFTKQNYSVIIVPL